jgi:hypothetical protein
MGCSQDVMSWASECEQWAMSDEQSSMNMKEYYQYILSMSKNVFFNILWWHGGLVCNIIKFFSCHQCVHVAKPHGV